MQLKIESQIIYSGEDMKIYLCTMLEKTGYNYMVDESKRVITVFEKPQSQKSEDPVSLYVNRIFGLLMSSPAFTETWCRKYPSLIAEHKSDWNTQLNDIEKMNVIWNVLKDYTANFLVNAYNVINFGVSNQRSINMNNEILEVISRYFDIREKADE